MAQTPQNASRLSGFEDLDDELASTRRMLERYPDGKGDWRPHPRSRSLAELATHVAGLPGLGATVITTDGIDVAARAPRPPLDSREALLKSFDEATAGFRTAFAKASEADLAGTWTLRAGPQVIVEGVKRLLLRRMMLSHMVHHRAQLGDDYRLLEVPVPATYGPSADEPLPH